MKKLDLTQLFNALSDDQYEKVRGQKDEVLTRKLAGRAQRRRLERNWQKYAKRDINR